MTWKRGGASPFLTGRARERAPQVIEYAAASGAAALVSPSGEIVLFAGSAVDVDLTRIARTARLLGAARTDVCFRAGEVCVQAAPVVHGWTLCVISIPPVAPSVTAERLHKAAHVLALALLDGVSPSGAGTPQGPAPAEAAVFASNRKPRAASFVTDAFRPKRRRHDRHAWATMATWSSSVPSGSKSFA